MTAEKLTSILDSLLSLPAETEVVEFKRAERNFDDRDLGQYFSALSNEANLKEKDCAWLIFGIENKSHEVVGSQYKNSRPALDAIKKKIADQTTGRHTFVEIYELLYRNGKRVVMFQIPPAPQGIPIAFQELNSTCKCNRILINNLFKFFVWREVSKSFTRSIIES